MKNRAVPVISKNIIILPYYSQEEVHIFSRLANIISNLGGLDGRFEFLLSARHDFPESRELYDLYSRIAPTRSFRGATQGKGIGEAEVGAKTEGPSAMFWDTMDFIEKNYDQDGGFALWMEADMVPLRKDWLEAISSEWVSNCLMMGFFVDRSKGLCECSSHINGGACYAKDFSAKAPRSSFDLMRSWDHQILNFLLKKGLRYKFISGIIDFRFRYPTLDWKPDEKVAILHGIKDNSAHEYVENKYGIAYYSGKSKSLGIFIKTCKKDHDWLKHCLRSIEKFAEGFEGVCIVTDDDHKEIYEYKDIIKKFPVQITLVDFPKNIKHNCHNGVGYIWMQNIKLNWHLYCDYDSALQIDSDCILTGNISPDTYLTASGLWKWWIRKWEVSEGAIVHKYPLERLLQRPTEHEHMLFNGWILDRNATKGFHLWIKKAHGCDWWAYLLEKTNEDWGLTKKSENWLKVSGGLPSGMTRGSSIYNAFGGYIEYVYNYTKNVYRFLEGYTEIPPIKQFWSWGGVKEEIVKEIERYLGYDKKT